MTLVNLNRPVRKSLDNVFDEFFNGFTAPCEGSYLPPANIYETKEGYHIEISAPGRAKEDFQVNIDNGLLTIAFEKKEESKTEDQKTIRREFSYRSFKRSFSLDEQVNVENVQAKYENGILKLFLTKNEPAKASTKQINVQ